MYTVVPYRQANLVQVERVHKGSAQQPRSLETIFVFNESLSDQADMSWNIQSTTQTRFVMIVLIGRVTQSNTFTEFLIWKIMGIFAKRWLPSVIDRKNIKHDIEVANDVSRCCGWLPGRCEELALIPTLGEHFFFCLPFIPYFLFIALFIAFQNKDVCIMQ